MKVFIFFCFLFVYGLQSCQQSPSKTGTSMTGAAAGLIPPDHNDPAFSGIPADTILPSGWKIEYLVKNDSSMHRDIYIRWSKNQKAGLFTGTGLLLFRSYFLPVVTDENADNIFLSHGCATGCAAVLVLSKTNLTFRDFEDVADYDAQSGKVVWIGSRDLTVESDSFQVTVTDVKTNRDTSVIFSNLGLGTMRAGYVDTVIYQNNAVTVHCTLFDRNDYYRRQQITEVKTIRF